MKHLSSTEFLKISKNNYFNEYITSLKDQIGSMKGEVLFLRQELRKNNVPAECKCIASTTDDTHPHNINKDNNNNHNRNENNSNKNIIQNLFNNRSSNYNANDNTE